MSKEPQQPIDTEYEQDAHVTFWQAQQIRMLFCTGQGTPPELAKQFGIPERILWKILMILFL